MRLDEAIRAVKRESGGGSIYRHDGHGNGRSITAGFVDHATWTVEDILGDWGISPPPEPEKPRSFRIAVTPGGDIFSAEAPTWTIGSRVYVVHDADQCDRLRKGKP